MTPPGPIRIPTKRREIPVWLILVGLILACSAIAQAYTEFVK
jgi:hypothetical protein